MGNITLIPREATQEKERSSSYSVSNDIVITEH